MTHHGSCHCKKVVVQLETDAAPEATPLRECACSFCRCHGAVTMTDPDGRVTLRFREEDVIRYRFGLRTADFIACRHCGVYVAAVMDAVCTLNVNTLEDRARFSQQPLVRDYGGELVEERIRRRRATWTPMVIET